MKTHTTAGGIARGAGSLRDFARSIVNRARIKRRDRADSLDRLMATQLVPSVQERHENLVRFYSHYEDLVDALCSAAQIGPTDRLEASYAVHKKWMEANYPSVRRYLTAYLCYLPDDDPEMMPQTAQPCDAFESLTAAPTLKECLAEDDGHMIDRITRTREALNLYGEHLRQLLARG